jgi:cysteine desulfurase
MGIPEDWARGTLRLTTGRMTTAGEIDRAAEVIIAAVRNRRRAPR